MQKSAFTVYGYRSCFGHHYCAEVGLHGIWLQILLRPSLLCRSRPSRYMVTDLASAITTVQKSAFTVYGYRSCFGHHYCAEVGLHGIWLQILLRPSLLCRSRPSRYMVTDLASAITTVQKSAFTVYGYRSCFGHHYCAEVGLHGIWLQILLRPSLLCRSRPSRCMVSSGSKRNTLLRTTVIGVFQSYYHYKAWYLTTMKHLCDQ